MKYIHQTITLVILLFLISCKQNKKNNTNFSIPLKTINYENRKILSPVTFYKDSTLFSNYKKEIAGDSTKIGYLPFIYSSVLNPLIEKKLINKNTLDTIKKGIYVLSGIKDGMQFYSLDLNQNNTFKDDKKYTFSTDVTFKTRRNFNIDSLFPPIQIIATKLSGISFYKDTLFARFYPDYQYFGYQEMDGEKELQKRLQIVGRFTDSYIGDFLLENEAFKVSVSKKENDGSYIKFAKLNDEYQDGFWNTYNYRDTVFLNKRYLMIDTLLQNPTQLVLKQLGIEKQIFGYKEGFKLKNYKIEDLKGNKVNLKELSNKKLLLLDFWGTWCGPCMELTPSLKELHSKYKSKLAIVSIAFQEEAKPVEKYVTKNKINWFNGIVKGKPKTFYPKEKIIKELKVRTFPGFFVVDKDFNIVFRTSGGGENFKTLVDFIHTY